MKKRQVKTFNSFINESYLLDNILDKVDQHEEGDFKGGLHSLAEWEKSILNNYEDWDIKGFEKQQQEYISKIKYFLESNPDELIGNDINNIVFEINEATNREYIVMDEECPVYYKQEDSNSDALNDDKYYFEIATLYKDKVKISVTVNGFEKDTFEIKYIDLSLDELSNLVNLFKKIHDFYDLDNKAGVS